MTIDLSLEAMVAIAGATGLLILALIAALTITVRTLSKVVKTIMTLNDELQETSKDRSQWHIKEGELTRAVGALTGQLTTLQDELTALEQRSQKHEDVTNAEIETLQTKNADLESEVERLQQAFKVERDLRRQDLASFQHQINEKNTEIAQLKATRRALENRLAKLETIMNGKVDKIDTDDLTESAARVTGAMSDQTTKDTEEKN